MKLNNNKLSSLFLFRTSPIALCFYLFISGYAENEEGMLVSPLRCANEQLATQSTTVFKEYYSLKLNKKLTESSVDFLLINFSNKRVVKPEFKQDSGKYVFIEQLMDSKLYKALQYDAFRVKNNFQATSIDGDTPNGLGVISKHNVKSTFSKWSTPLFDGILEEEPTDLVYQDRRFQNGVCKSISTPNLHKLAI